MNELSSSYNFIRDTLYLAVFNTDSNELWSGTEWAQNPNDISYRRAMNCFLDDSPTGVKDRLMLTHCYLKSHYSDAEGSVFDEAVATISSSNDMFNRAINVVSSTYQKAPTREYTDEKFGEIVEESPINDLMLKSDRLQDATGECLVQPYLDSDGKIAFFTYRNDQYRLKKDDFGNIEEAWFLDFEFNEDKSTYLDWRRTFRVYDKTNKWKVSATGEISELEPNGLGVFPFAYIENKGTLKYDWKSIAGGRWELAFLQIQLNSKQFPIDYVDFRGSLGFWFGTDLNNVGDESQDVNFGINKFINTESAADGEKQPDIEYKKADHNSSDVYESKEALRVTSLQDMGLPSMTINPDPSSNSGIARKIDRIELDNATKENQEPLRQFEQQVMDLIALNLNVKNGTSYSSEYSIIYESREIRDTAEQIESENQNLELGIISIVDLARTRGMRGTDEEIINKLQDNQEINKQIRKDDEPDGTESDDTSTGTEE